MGTRYDDRRLLKNDMKEYQRFFDERGVNFIRQYDTANFRYPSQSEILQLQRVQHVWSVGDRYYKLAAQYYSNPGYWWVIAHYNKRPTEAQVNTGDLIFIRLPLEKILGYIMS